MGMGIDQAGEQGVVRKLVFRSGLIVFQYGLARPYGLDAPIMDNKAVIIKHHARGFHRDHPAGVDNSIDLLHK
jgi:hypothetical protein